MSPLPPPTPPPEYDSQTDSDEETNQGTDEIFGLDKKNEIITIENGIKKSKKRICNAKESCFPGSWCQPILNPDGENCNEDISQF